MAKDQPKETPKKEPKAPKASKGKVDKHKERNALVGRVKKAVKKSRRKLSEEKFEKELLRTIAFLEGLQVTLAKSKASAPPVPPVPAAAPAAKPARKKAAAKTAKKK